MLVWVECGVLVLFPCYDVCATAVVHTECYATAYIFTKTGINGQRVLVGGHFEVLRRRGLVVV